jgi:asparagine synthase (glutamine-hydrolysing)
LREVEDTSGNEQPLRIDANRILTWDGRLDNRTDLLRELAGAVHSSDSDVAIVAAAYRQWALACLPKLVGDWALSIWDSQQQQLVLAKDFLGTRPLFYSIDENRAQWSSVLDPLVLFAGRRFALNREYLAGWFGLFPASHLTPYIGIHSVPPASYVVIRRNSVRVKEFWRFKVRPALTYQRDADYEEHFRELFRQAVERRLRSPFPVMAELSGGMDSSSIVCMADRILTTQGLGTPRLETVTYYNTMEPNWNELPYVEKVEARRGRAGSRIEVSSDDAFHFDSDVTHFMATPGSLHSSGKSGQEFSQVLQESGSRVLLSGIGGDEVLGGAPSPIPLLADLVTTGRLRALAIQLLAWALVLRKPFFSILAETLQPFCRIVGSSLLVPPWLCPAFLDENSDAVHGYPHRTRLFGPRPSFQANMGTMEALRRQLASFPLSPKPAYHKSYPYLDRDLLEFLFSVPPDQLLRPGQRRSLMRRALAGILPKELLHRKRKAFVIREPLAAIAAQSARLREITKEMITGSLAIVDPRIFAATLDEVRSGGAVPLPSLLRTFGIERWLRNAAHWNVLVELDSFAPTTNVLCKNGTQLGSLRTQIVS